MRGALTHPVVRPARCGADNVVRDIGFSRLVVGRDGEGQVGESLEGIPQVFYALDDGLDVVLVAEIRVGGDVCRHGAVNGHSASRSDASTEVLAHDHSA